MTHARTLDAARTRDRFRTRLTPPPAAVQRAGDRRRLLSQTASSHGPASTACEGSGRTGLSEATPDFCSLDADEFADAAEGRAAIDVMCAAAVAI
ncbi:hypothetical protein HPB50_015520 [Hyalomma asiaticum]|uniref:Uncharacterized protein n=1 Tax=Hyalomma asiaticum TaxID=266040 RepID=A0ACB7S985_HYAAI|nr:hypothetical protein HPB50_015520 [Hyalomma asiaticum]